MKKGVNLEKNYKVLILGPKITRFLHFFYKNIP